MISLWRYATMKVHWGGRWSLGGGLSFRCGSEWTSLVDSWELQRREGSNVYETIISVTGFGVGLDRDVDFDVQYSLGWSPFPGAAVHW